MCISLLYYDLNMCTIMVRNKHLYFIELSVKTNINIQYKDTKYFLNLLFYLGFLIKSLKRDLLLIFRCQSVCLSFTRLYLVIRDSYIVEIFTYDVFLLPL